MNCRFYRLEVPREYAPTTVDSEYRCEIWRPKVLQTKPYCLPYWPFNIWWLFHMLHIFSNPDYSIVLIWNGEKLIHRSCMFPRYFRFPFMAAQDLQIGDTWTDPDYRGRELAAYALERAVQSAATSPRHLWYIVEES